ncbi:hypothetical protein CFK37_03835 [Virgibacillus phasianinus]|uniref:Lipoprotein n=2 Tax=Virgibacillus phasianinus TaxID=2017483 RepID=A0A220U0D1_9BACI|nr:hypothetical protein CFK37_03835 [Virgibacillus phasianinus]
MRKRFLVSLIVMSFLLVLSACGDDGEAKDNKKKTEPDKPEVGLNKITLDKIVAKKNDNEAFYLLLFDANKEDVKKTKFLDAYDKALKKQDITAYYLNMNDKDKKTLGSLEKEFKQQSASSHNPFEDGGLTVVYDGKLDSPFDYYAKAWVLNITLERLSSEKGTFLQDDMYNDIKKGIQYNLDYVKEHDIELTY